MRTITQSLVEEVWREMTSYAPERVAAEAQAFLERQPHVAAFAQAVAKDLDESVQKAGLGLSFLLFKILDASLGRPFPPLWQDRIVSAHERTAEWLAHGPGADPGISPRSADVEPHPSLVAYILEVFYRGDRAAEEAISSEYDPEVRASLVLLLRTLTDAVDLGEVEA